MLAKWWDFQLLVPREKGVHMCFWVHDISDMLGEKDANGDDGAVE